MKKLHMGMGWYKGNSPRWRLGRGLLWLSMFVVKLALWVLPVPKGTKIWQHFELPKEEVENYGETK